MALNARQAIGNAPQRLRIVDMGMEIPATICRDRCLVQVGMEMGASLVQSGLGEKRAEINRCSLNAPSN